MIIGSEYADILFRQGNRGKALEFHRWIAKESPRHRKAATSHYAIALQAYKSGDFVQTRISGYAARLCFAAAPALLDEWEVDCRSALLLKRVGVESDFARFNHEFINTQEEALDIDISRY